jgi:inner membrane protein
MTSRTHDLAALTALNIVIITQPILNISLATALVAIMACFLGGLGPDMDDPTSDLWHNFPAGSLLGKLLHPFLGGHRLISHSFLGFLIISFVVKYLLGLASHTFLVNMGIVWASFVIGYVSHLIMDALTIEGIPLFFPIPIYVGFPPLKILRIKTGGKIEKGLVFPGLLLINIYLFYNFYPTYLDLLKLF